MLTLNPTTHTYTYAGRQVPSVTEIIRTKYPLSKWVPDSALERGSAVHQGCCFVDGPDSGGLKVTSEAMPYIRAYGSFLFDTGTGIVLSEKSLYHSVYGYAGTLDRVLKLWGKLAIVELKCNEAPEWVGLQLAAYAHLIMPELGVLIPPEDRYALELKKTGKYKLRPSGSHSDWPEFLECLTNYRKAVAV